jgi:alpha-L-fucosidase
MGHGFGYNRDENSSQYKTTEFVVSLLVRTASLGGNMEISIGPTGDGLIDNVVQERLLRLGDWLRVNGDAIYATRRWRVDREAAVEGRYYTASSSSDTVFLIFDEYREHLEYFLAG